MMNTNFAVVLVMVYSYLPFMVLPLYANLEKLDTDIERSRHGSGLTSAGRCSSDVTLPLSIPGIIAGGLACVHSGHPAN
jgi:putrescine transport system permease protein